MNKSVVIGALGGAVSVGMLALGFFSGRLSTPAPAPEAVVEAPAADAPGLDRPTVETIVREYLLANPELIEEVQVALEDKKQAEQKLAQNAVIKDASADIFNSAEDGLIGNPDGDVTLVEFFDYNCGYCKRALSDMQAMVAADPKLRFVLKEFPILGPESQKASQVSMAFKALMPGKYADFHLKLMAYEGRAGEESAIKMAVELGADEAALRKEMESPAIAAIFAKTYELANRLSITGTPSYVVGDEIIPGALGQDVLGQKVVNVRNCKSTTC